MAHFVGYNTNDPNAGQYTKIALVKGSINSSVTEVEVEKEEGTNVPTSSTFTALIGEELVSITRAPGSSTWQIERKQHGTTAASHSAKAEILVPTGQNFLPLMVNQELVLGPFQTEKAEKIAGSIYSEQAGTLFVQQSFDGGEHWDVTTEKSVTAATPATIEVNVVAPVAQVKFVNGSTKSKEVRLFVRAGYQQGR